MEREGVDAAPDMPKPKVAGVAGEDADSFAEALARWCDLPNAPDV